MAFLVLRLQTAQFWRLSNHLTIKTREAKGLLAKGIDPSEQKKNAREARIIAERTSFENIAQEWHKTILAGLSAKHQGTVLYRLNTYIFPATGKRHIARLEVQDILAIVKPIDEKGNNETSRRVLKIISQVFRYAVVLGKARHNITADLHGVLFPRNVTHRTAVLKIDGS